MEAKELNMYFDDLEILREEKADFPAFYNLLIDGLKDLSESDRALFAYGVLNDVRDLGARENAYNLKQRIIEKVNEL